MKNRLAIVTAPLLAATMAVGLLAAAPAQAQSSNMNRVTTGPIVGGTGANRGTSNMPPPGLPGAQGSHDRVAPAEHPASDMAPTDALFDAVNRGDINAARDAIARGADFNAHNVLGMTPLDESIDLSRNDITFLLLSLRGSAPEPAATPAKATKAASLAARPVEQQAVRTPAPQPAPAPRPVAQSNPPPAPPRAADPGTPNPQSGFLGFGG